ncbi:hypothetical protein B0O80DRAFT_504573 [Mortierella sp. GBAus27b]|nr:hypothetical protein B0O80DRAFT_504573 [Mortierella sp. GBAus27b]
MLNEHQEDPLHANGQDKSSCEKQEKVLINAYELGQFPRAFSTNGKEVKAVVSREVHDNLPDTSWQLCTSHNAVVSTAQQEELGTPVLPGPFDTDDATGDSILLEPCPKPQSTKYSLLPRPRLLHSGLRATRWVENDAPLDLRPSQEVYKELNDH